MPPQFIDTHFAVRGKLSKGYTTKLLARELPSAQFHGMKEDGTIRI